MAREKENFRDVVEHLVELNGGKLMFNCRQIMRALGVGHNKAADLLGGSKEISVYQLSRLLLK